MSMDESRILGRMADLDFFDDQTQEEVNEQSLFEYDQATLLAKVSDPDLSKYELEFLIESIDGSSNEVWNYIFTEIIKTFNLNTLKMFMSEILEVNNDKIIELLRFLKVGLKEIMVDKKLTFSNRDILVKELGEEKAPSMLLFALETISSSDYEKFVKNYIY